MWLDRVKKTSLSVSGIHYGEGEFDICIEISTGVHADPFVSRVGQEEAVRSQGRLDRRKFK